MKQEEGWYRIARLGRLHYESAHRRNRKLSLVLFYPCMLHLLCCAQCGSAFSSRFRSSFVGAHFPFLFPALYLCEIASSIRCYVINPIKDNRSACLSAIAEIRKHGNTETRKHGNTETRKHGKGKFESGRGRERYLTNRELYLSNTVRGCEPCKPRPCIWRSLIQRLSNGQLAAHQVTAIRNGLTHAA